ncbi:MAG: hypothetical protein LRZ85_09935 [Alphaproteobacteria bacterium]|nr:hypothetical protein [Alphaproteobacteria bacterium]
MKEFDIIEKLKPLALGKPEAAGFANDAACLNVPEGYELVVTSDCATMGVHFLADQRPAQSRKKPCGGIYQTSTPWAQSPIATRCACYCQRLMKLGWMGLS